MVESAVRQIIAGSTENALLLQTRLFPSMNSQIVEILCNVDEGTNGWESTPGEVEKHPPFDVHRVPFEVKEYIVES